MTRTPDVSSLLSSLTRDRLVEIAQTLGVSLPAWARKERQMETLLASAQLRFATLLAMLHRDELKGACRFCGLNDGGPEPCANAPAIGLPRTAKVAKVRVPCQTAPAPRHLAACTKKSSGSA